MGSGSSKGPKPTLYYCGSSPPSRAVLMVAREANIQLDTNSIDVLKGEQMSEEFIKINPDHTVPTLDDKGFKLWESRAIMTYLVDTYAAGHRIYPRDTKQRAEIDRLLMKDLGFVFRHISAFMIPQLMEKQAADAAKAAEVEKVLDYLENTLKEDGKFLAGTDHVTVADFSIMASLTMLEFNDWKFERWTRLEKWREAMKKLPYYEEVNQPVEEAQMREQ